MRNRRIQVVGLVLLIGVAAPIRAHATPVTCSAIAGNLVENCGFETGDFTDWQQSGNTNDTFVGTSKLVPVNTGSYAASLGPAGSVGNLFQPLSSTVKNDEYKISFYLDSVAATPTSFPNSFSVLFGGIVDYAMSDFVTTGYELVTFTVSAPVNAATLEFTFQNDPSMFALDDVSVVNVATREPSSLALIGLGLLMVAFIGRRRITENRKTMKNTPAVA